MVSSDPTLGQHVVYMDFYILANLVLKNLVHQSLVCCTYILKLKGHYLAIVDPIISDKDGLLLIFWYHPYLIVTQEGIHEGKEVMTGSCID